MIVRSVVVLIALFIVYGVGVKILFPEGGSEQTMRQANAINAQNYIFERERSEYIIIGTSLVSRLRRSIEDNRFRTIYFQGGSTLTALRLIEATEKKPKVVFIETNLLLRSGEDTEFLNTHLDPAKRTLFSIMPALREKYQPVSIFLKFFKAVTGADKTDFFSRANTDKASLDFMLSINKKEFSVIPEKASIEANKVLLEELVRELENNGVKIVLFELPMHPLLTDSPLIKTFRASIKDSFPPEKYRWITAADANAYSTTDGLHLDTESGKKFLTLLKSNL